ncbi:MAG: hypothetical protein AAFR56_09660 [Chloroflexota bacterium]
MRRYLLMLCLLFALAATAHAQSNSLIADDPPYFCPNTASPHYQNAFPRYDVATRSLILVDGTTDETVRTLGPIENNVRIINWSPDCRYLSGAVGLIITSGEVEWLEGEDFVSWTGRATSWEETRRIAIWDAIAGQRIGTSPLNYGRYLFTIGGEAVLWSPDSTKAIIRGGCYSVFDSCVFERVRIDYIFTPSTGQFTRIEGLTGNFEENAGNFNQVFWEPGTNRIWSSGVSGIPVYDLNSGERVAYYTSGTPAYFAFSPDRTHLITYVPEANLRFPAFGSVRVYNLQTGEAQAVNVEGFAARLNADPNRHAVALSLDNRYLAAGYDAIRVWDLQNLPAAEAERLPIYRHGGPQALINELRFADNGVIETVSADGVQQWDLHTGVYIP